MLQAKKPKTPMYTILQRFSVKKMLQVLQMLQKS